MKAIQNVLIAIVIILLVASFATSGLVAMWLAISGAVVAVAALAFAGNKNQK